MLLFIVFILFRFGGLAVEEYENDFFGWGTIGWDLDVNLNIFGIMASAGYFFFVIIVIIGIVMGDNNNKFTVMRILHKTLKKINFQLLLFNFFGFLFFIALGIEQIRVWKKFDRFYNST